jgi:hypothetical protein
MNPLRRFSQAARRRLGVPVWRDEPDDHRAALFVAGSGRSGTTWLSELLLAGTRRRYVFEPLSRNLALTAPFHREYGKLYLRPDGDYPEHFLAMRAVLTGRVRSRWTERFNRRLFADGRLVKEIRANLLLGWLQHNFPGMPLVLLLRHPCAVAASFVREGWRGRLDELLVQPDLCAAHLTAEQLDVLSRLARGSLFERALGLWCVETRVALREVRQGAYVLCYEQLLWSPEYALASLLDWLGRGADLDRVLARVGRDSATTRGARVLSLTRISGWRREITDYQLQTALAVLRVFNLDGLYGEHPLPSTREGLQPWLGPDGGRDPTWTSAHAGPGQSLGHVVVRRGAS